jgi:outer membrane protein TolC
MLPPEEAIVIEGALGMAGGADTPAPAGQNESLSAASLRKSIEVLEAQRKGALYQAYAPALSLSWNTSPMYAASPLSGDRAWADSGQFTVAISFNLDNFLPGSVAKEQAASLNDAIAGQQSLLKESLLNSRSHTEQLRRNISQSLETIKTLALNVILAEETYAMYEESYRQGAADLQSLRSARDSLSLAQNHVLEEQYNLASAVLDLEKELNIPFGSL